MHKIYRMRAVSPETHHAPGSAIANRATRSRIYKIYKIHKIRAVSPETHHAPGSAISNRATLKQEQDLQDLHDLHDSQDARGFVSNTRPGGRGLKPRNPENVAYR